MRPSFSQPACRQHLQPMSSHREVKATLWTRNFVLLSTANFLMFTAFYFLIPVLPVYISSELHGSKSMVGLILAVYTLSALLIRPLTGAAIDGLGRRLIYLVSMVVFSILFNFYILAGSIVILLVLRFIHGFTWGVTTTSGITAAVDVIPPTRRGEGIGIYGLSFTIAMAVGPLLGTVLLEAGNYHLVFIAAFLISLAGWLLALQVRYPIYLPANGGRISTRKMLEARAMPVSLNLLILNITYGGIISFIALYARELNIANPGYFFLLYAIGVAFSRPAAGRIFDRWGPRWLIGPGACFVISGFMIITSWKSPEGFYLSAVLLGFGGGVITPTFQAMVNNLIEPGRRGAANSTLFTALDMGIGGGMVLIGFLAEITSLTVAFRSCVLIALAAIVFFFKYAYPHYKKYHIPATAPQV